MTTKLIQCALLALAPALFLAGCGREFTPSSESELHEAAAVAPALQAFSDLLNGAEIQTVLKQYNLTAKATTAAWDYYKAQQGIDFVQGQKVPALGAKRRAWIRAAEIHSKAIREAATDRALLHTIRLKVERLYMRAFKEEKGLTYNAPVFSYASNLVQDDLDKINPVLAKIPSRQMALLDPIFIVDKLPGSRADGGGYFAPQEVASWLGKSMNTGVPDQDIKDYVQASGRGIIAITRKALMKKDIHPFTILHEAAHSLDFRLGITPAGATAATFLGVYYGGGNQTAKELAAEAYSRYLINKNRICSDRKDESTGKFLYIPAGETVVTCSARILKKLKTTPAMQ
ncbi:hypothetical protein [Oligoflexus tunisiensis]|uniref:hypothetical protein n=1 Tax=Oligoflexus tunisiensis TaxID=708132 RepID=UPI00114CA6E7|nr:hypothetical protein [Oligoflexus tunisiensis]